MWIFCRWLIYLFVGLFFLRFIKCLLTFPSFLLLKLNLITSIYLLILLDWVSISFSFTVLFISLIIIIFRDFYVGLFFISRFISLFVLFVFSILFLIFNPRLIRALLGWDGLGFSSFCLVIFYQNHSSLNSSIITILRNRLGDGFLLLVLIILLFDGSFYFSFLRSKELIFRSLIIIGALTKRAQFPFFVWLPLAIAAPTPISALVHSSTLVTAGIFLLIRFHYILSNTNIILFLIAGIVSFQSGLIALLEGDRKKIIALSTLSQLSIMIICLFMNLWKQSFFHLLTHAFFKSILFVSIGIFIIKRYGNQISRSYGVENRFLFLSIIFIRSFNLIGIPITSGFISKDGIIEIFSSFSTTFSITLIFLACFSTLVYSVRFLFILAVKIKKEFLRKEKDINHYRKFLSFFTILTSIVLGVYSFILFGENINMFLFRDKILGLIIMLFLILYLLFHFSENFSNVISWLSSTNITKLRRASLILRDSLWLEIIGPQNTFLFIITKNQYLLISEKKHISLLNTSFMSILIQ